MHKHTTDIVYFDRIQNLQSRHTDLPTCMAFDIAIEDLTTF